MPKTKRTINCKNCNSSSIIKKGIKKNKLQSIQRYFCKDCNSIFTLQQTKNKTYPMQIILKATSTYNIGYNLSQTQEKIAGKHKIKVPLSTISSWLNQYKNICTFHRLRKTATIINK